ncbi:MAG TPA: CidA/LrgA family protein [Clostridia bacterium]|nr:CidA/LrgA family protein [Clostridia bacterium]
MIKGMTILVLLLTLGEILSRLLPLPIPGNVIGLILMVIALSIGVVKLEQVEEAGNLLLNNLPVFFIPAGISIILYFDLIRAEWLPILVSIIASTLIVLVTTGKLVDFLQKRWGSHE